MMEANSMQAILPLIRPNTASACILVHSLSRFAPWLSRLHVVCPDRDVDYYTKGFAGFSFVSVIPESRLFPESRTYTRVARYFKPARGLFASRQFSGWYLQQVLKLAAPGIVDSEFFLTLDADTVAIRPIALDELIQNRRAICVRYRNPEVHPEWYEASARILGIPRTDYRHGVTPAILSTEAVRMLTKHLEDCRREIKGGALNPGRFLSKRSWRSILMREQGWTEYSLYFSFLENQGLFEDFHFEASGNPLYNNSVFTSDYLKYLEEDSQPEWQEGNRSAFTVLQSTLNLEIARTWDFLNKLVFKEEGSPFSRFGFPDVH
jgi:hypothetical protein